MTPGYCAICEQELHVSSITGQGIAWCPRCQQVVELSRIPKWVDGVLCVLLVNVTALHFF